MIGGNLGGFPLLAQVGRHTISVFKCGPRKKGIAYRCRSTGGSARCGVEILCDLLHRFANNVGVLISASATLGIIALDNTENQNAIREAGAIPLIVGMVDEDETLPE